MSELNFKLLPWQQEVLQDKTRFKVVAAGRRTGKSRLAAIMLILAALNDKKGQVFYVAPTQGQARDIMWQQLLDIAHPVIESSHINNLEIRLINGAKINLKGADRPETMRGVSLKFVVFDEYADMKPTVFDQIIRPALADNKGDALFIGTPMGRNHFYDTYQRGLSGEDKTLKSWHFTSYNNPLLDKEEIEAAKKSMSSFAFRQEFLCSFDSAGSDIFKEDWIKYSPTPPTEGDWYISIDLAGFGDVDKLYTSQAKKLDQTAITIAKVNTDGWYVDHIEYGRWGVKETAEVIFRLVKEYKPRVVGIERGIAKQAVMLPLTDLMKQQNFFFSVQEMTHGNKRKYDRIVWALQGRFEHGRITLNKGGWNEEFLDELYQFPNPKVHDDLIDSLAYIEQIANISYLTDFEDTSVEPFDIISGY
jgi:predicted phage terminase large subunit-like protein